MGVRGLLKNLFCKNDSYSKLKTRTGEFERIIKKESDLLKEFIYFRKLTGSEWQTIDALKTQLAHNIISNKLTFAEASASNYVFDLIRLSWVDALGGQVINNKSDFEGLANGEICAVYVNELSRLALEANGFIINTEDLKKK
jgi:hypothetical protein